MYSKAKGIRLLLLCVLGSATFAGQQKVQSQGDPADGKAASRATKSRDVNLSQSLPLNTSEGLSVIGAALESRGGDRSTLDCSHLVHTVYEHAGFPYSYVSSSDLYAGVEKFRRVTRPQPGDLVVWPGHVGIVVDPSQKTFFSTLSSGIGVEPYSSSYWKERGMARFYRYAKAIATNNKESKISTPGSARTAFDVSANAQTLSSVDVSPTNIKPPRAQVIDSARPQPEEITQAALLALNIDPDNFRGGDVFKLPRPVVVFSRLEVRAIKIHGNQGQVQVRITAPLSMAGGQANLETRQQTQTWQLRRRDRKSWELLLPQDAIYMSRDTTVQILAHQLARLADTESSSADLRQESQLAQMLNTLLTE